MALPLLLPLLASLQSLPRPVTPTVAPVLAHLPAATLSLHHSYTAFLPGQRVTLTCSTPWNMWVSGYRFFHQKGQKAPRVILSPTAGFRLEFTAEKTRAGSYTCVYWRLQYNTEISSENSNSVSITVTAPQLTVSPLQPVYIAGENVTLTCSASRAPAMSGIQFFRDGQKIHSKEILSPQYNFTDSLQPSGVSGSQARAYSCGYWWTESGQEIPSERSRPISIAVTDSPPQPALSVNPPFRAVSEGLPLLLTCTAPGNMPERRFHFYKDGTELLPGEAGSELSSSSRNGSVLCIPWAWSNHTGEFTCGYEDNVSGRWISSPRSQAVNVTVNATRAAPHNGRDILLTTGGGLLVAGALAALLCCCRRKQGVPEPLKSTEGCKPGGCTRNQDPGRDNKRLKPGAEQMEQGTEITYSPLEFLALKAHPTQSKNRTMPMEEEHVLYSEVVTTHIRKAAT